MHPTPIHPAGSSNSSAATPVTPVQATATRNPKVVLVAGLGILALIMVAVIGIIAGVKKSPAPTEDFATGSDYPRSADTGVGSGTTNITGNLPGSGLVNELPQPMGSTATLPPAAGSTMPGAFSVPNNTAVPLPGSASATLPPTFNPRNPWNPNTTLMDPPATTTGRTATPSGDNASTTASTTGTTATRTTLVAADPKRYTVKESDTLWKIAQTHLGNGSQWRQIVAANPGLTPEKLRAGMQITLPTRETPSGPRSSDTASVASSLASSATSVTVKPGDTLYAIARREYGNGELWDLIYRANQSKLANPHNLPAGVTLTLPAKPGR